MRSIILCGAAPPVSNRRALVMGLQLRIVNPLTTIYTVPAMKTSVRRRCLYGPAPYSLERIPAIRPGRSLPDVESEVKRAWRPESLAHEELRQSSRDPRAGRREYQMLFLPLDILFLTVPEEGAAFICITSRRISPRDGLTAS
jgi:hypothetical protein